MKLLADPKLADDKAHQAAFERTKKSNGSPPMSLYCAVANDREEADPWLTLRHTGANEGVGVRVWSAEQTARHRKRMKAPVDSGTLRSIAIADELTEAYQADAALVELIKRVRTDKLTNIGRFFSGVTLTRMQFVMKQITDAGPQTLWAKHTADQLHPYFTWAFDFLGKNSVDAFKNDTLRGHLLNEHAELVPSAGESLADHVRIADHPYSPDSDPSDEEDAPGGDDETDRASGAPRPDADKDDSDHSAHVDEESDADDTSGLHTGSGRRRDQKEERCLYSGVKLTNLSPNIQRLLKEAKQLPIKDNYASACVLARVILELSVSDPKVLAWAGKKESDTLGDKIKGCIVTLDPLIDSPRKRSRQDLVQAYLETKEIGVIYLHQFMHNPSAKSDPHLARRFSSAYTPLLNSINESVK